MRTLQKTLFVAAGTMLLAFAVFAREPEPPRPPRPPHAPDHDVLIFRSGGSRLGIRVEDIDADRARALKMKEETGVEVRSVVEGSPAAEAGLREGDVILEYQGARVESAAQLVRMVRETPPGRTVTIQAWREGAPRTFKVKVAESDHPEVGREVRRHRFVVPPIEIPEFDFDVPDVPELGSLPTFVRLGASVETLTEQLAEFFGVKGGEGVLVRSVRKGSPGESAGLRAGDVIVRVDDRSIGDASELRAAIRGRGGQDITLGIVRDRREQKLQLKLPREEEPSGGRRFRWHQAPEAPPDPEAIDRMVREPAGSLPTRIENL